MTNKVNMEVEDDEDDDDVDFNPTWRGESLSEASSGLSSDNEATGDDIGEVFSSSLKHQGDGVSPRKSVITCRNLDSGTEDEEIVMQNRLTAEDVTGKDVVLEKPEVEELNRFNWQEEESAHPEGSYKKAASGDESEAAEELTKEELPGQATSSSYSICLREQAVEIDDEDAICKRTRARHSLANYTLEELEAFLQESDDDDDLQNVDDEEEYRKFLAAVLLGGDGNGQAGQDDEILDEDEENDADFAIEIEEALESDIDESFDDDKRRSDKNEEDVHRPETRQKKRLRESAEKKKCFLGLDKMPLRPILPYVSNAQIAPVPALGLRFHSPESFSHCPFAFSGADLTHGFTYQQLGQLYCLIHEHVQLLIQVFSVSVLDSSRQQVAMEVQELIMEMVARHEEGLARRKAPYDMSCFQAPNIHASLQIDSSESSEFSHWTPSIDGPIFSILDVVPLQLAKSYMADVSATVLRYRQSHLDDPVDKSHLKREPLFPFPMLTSQMGTDQILYGEPNGIPSKTALPPPPGQLPPKKSLAATLVENTKKQTVALVPMEIAKLAKRFYPLFNLALFPHKPPVPAVANRVLFTDAEDELLAMGLMKYNNDWGAIQKHFLPCKTKHQIFVRQKNRSSSKAPANPIKAVRRMKTSPLTADEKARIYEGLKLFKQDWLSVWKYFVRHRDPSLLPRQWRIATGTQKSYRKSEAIKEKRRLYEAKRRRLKASMVDGHPLSEKEVDNEEDNSGEDMDNENEAYVHEAFLADTETGSSNNLSYEISLSGIGRSNVQFTNMIIYHGTNTTEKFASSSECFQVQKDRAVHEINNSLKPMKSMHPLSHCSDPRYTSSYTSQLNHLSSISNFGRPGSHLGSLPCPTRKCKGARVVKLAPGLPPINLPPSVRVISQSALQNHPSGSAHAYTSKNGVRNPSKSSGVAKGESTVTNPGENLIMPSDNGPEASHRQVGGATSDQHVAEENASQSDLQMHPLLFHASEDQLSSYYSMNTHPAASGTCHLGAQLQKDSIFSKSQHCFTMKDRISGSRNSIDAPLDLFSVDFHPLLRRTNNATADLGMVSSVDPGVFAASSHHNKLSCDSNPVSRENLVGNSQIPAGGAPLCHHEKENELDLDIHLYSVKENEKTRQAGDSSMHQFNKSGSPRFQPTMDKGIDADMSFQHNANCSESAASRTRGCCEKDVNSLQVVQMPNDCLSQCTKDYDESDLDIIMEQEELSDSDDESANVEFECEEIDDSEDDESEYGQSTEALIKEVPTAAIVRKSNQDSCNFNHSRRSTPIRQGSVEEEINQSSLGQSCQNPCHTLRLKPKHEDAKRDISSKSSQEVVHSLPGQFGKARNPRSLKVQPLGATPHAISPDNECSKIVAPRKPRKRCVNSSL